MAFFGGSTGVIYRQFSVTIVSAMLLSVVVALVLTPALAATLLRRPAEHPEPGAAPAAGGRAARWAARLRNGFNVRFERAALPEPNGRDVLPLVEMGQHLGVDVEVGGHPHHAVLDTQSSAAIDCAPEIADSLRFVSGRVPTGSASIGGQPPVPVFSARLDGDVRLGATTIERPIVGIVSPPPGFPRELLLGARLLRHFVITLDQRNKRIRVSTPDRVIPPPPGLRSIGLALAPAPQGGVEVAAARADGAAYASGLRVSDEVVKIAGRPAAEFLQPSALPTLVQSADVVRFEVRRNGQPMAFDVVPRVLIP